jgi:thioredoxin 1
MKQLLVFSASWCSSCQSLKKTLSELNIHTDELVIYDIDDKPNLANHYNVRSVPTLLIVEGDVVIKRTTGNKTIKELQEFVL